MIELFKDGDSMGIRTDHSDSDDFLLELSSLLAELIDSGGYANDWEFQLRFWLPQAVEICVKIKGYKSPTVSEKRVLHTGNIEPRDAVKTAGMRPVRVEDESPKPEADKVAKENLSLCQQEEEGRKSEPGEKQGRQLRTFNQWLRTKKSEESAVGDLARDASDDPTWPKGQGLMPNDFRDYMGNNHASDAAMRALASAWVRFSIWRKEG